MKLGALFSGGKDSCYALYKESEENEIACLLSVVSENQESYMFHTPNIHLTKLQAEAMNMPLLTETTKGVKEEELKDLKKLIQKAKEKYKIEGITTGAIASNYQASRINKLCDELKLKCISPLWKRDQIEIVKEMISNKFEIKIVAIACEGLGEEWLGKTITKENFDKINLLSKKFGFNPAFEGGEAETLVIDCPLFKKRLNIIKAKKEYKNNNGIYLIEKAELVDKN